MTTKTQKNTKPIKHSYVIRAADMKGNLGPGLLKLVTKYKVDECYPLRLTLQEAEQFRNNLPKNITLQPRVVVNRPVLGRIGRC